VAVSVCRAVANGLSMLRIVELSTAAAWRVWTSRSLCSLCAFSALAVQATARVITRPVRATIMAVRPGVRDRRAAAPSGAPRERGEIMAGLLVQ
jgi:hypothetical protein